MPTTEQRSRSPRAKESQLRRATLLGQRAKVEELMVRTGHLSRDEAVRLRALDEDGFVRAYRKTVMKLRQGIDPRVRSDRTDRTGRKGRDGRRGGADNKGTPGQRGASDQQDPPKRQKRQKRNSGGS